MFINNTILAQPDKTVSVLQGNQLVNCPLYEKPFTSSLISEGDSPSSLTCGGVNPSTSSNSKSSLSSAGKSLNEDIKVLFQVSNPINFIKLSNFSID